MPKKKTRVNALTADSAKGKNDDTKRILTALGVGGATGGTTYGLIRALAAQSDAVGRASRTKQLARQLARLGLGAGGAIAGGLLGGHMGEGIGKELYQVGHPAAAAAEQLLGASSPALEAAKSLGGTGGLLAGLYGGARLRNLISPRATVPLATAVGGALKKTAPAAAILAGLLAARSMLGGSGE